MATVQSSVNYLDELLDFIASQPTSDQILNYRPSQLIQDRASQLLTKQNSGPITLDEEEELDQFAQAEMFMQLLVARVRARQSP